MSKSVFWSKFVNPDDGYAYSKIELAGLWELPVRIDTIVLQREKRFAFFLHCATKFADKADQAIADLIARATVAEAIDNNPIEPEPTVPDCFRIDNIDPKTGLPKKANDAT